MDKYQQKLCIGIAASSVSAFIGLKIFAAIYDNELHFGHYLVCGLALTGVFIGGYDLGWHLGFQQQQQKVKDLQTKCAELEVKIMSKYPTTVSDKNYVTQQPTIEASDSDDSEDYDAVRIKSV